MATNERDLFPRLPVSEAFNAERPGSTVWVAGRGWISEEEADELTRDAEGVRGLQDPDWDTRQVSQEIQGIAEDDLSRRVVMPRQPAAPQTWRNPVTPQESAARWYGQQPMAAPGASVTRPNSWRQEEYMAISQQRSPLEQANGDSFWQRTWEFASEFAKETARSFNPLEEGISRRERWFRRANVASLALPVGWMAQLGKLGLTMPAARAWAMTAKGRVAMHALEGAVVSGGLELIRDPEERGEHGALLAAGAGAVLGAGAGALLDRSIAKTNLAVTRRVMERVVDPATMPQTLLDPSVPWAIIPHDRLDVPMAPGMPARTAARLEQHLRETGFASVPIKYDNNMDGHLVAGLNYRQAAAVARELGLDQVITSRGLVHAEQKWLAPMDRAGSKIGLAVPQGSSWVSIPSVHPNTPASRVSFSFDLNDTRRLGTGYAQLDEGAGTPVQKAWGAIGSMMDQEGATRGGSLWQRYGDLDTRSVVGHWYSGVVNRMLGAKVLDDLMNPNVRVSDLAVSRSLSKTIQMSRTGWAGRAEQAIRYKLRDKAGMVRYLEPPSAATPNGISSLEDILETLRTDEMEAFERYGLARYLDDLARRMDDPKQGLPQGALPPSVVKHLETLRPELAKAPKHFDVTLNRIVKWRNMYAEMTLVDAGVISKAEHERFVRSSPFAVPWHAIAQDMDDTDQGMVRALASFDPVKHLAEVAKHGGTKYTPWLEELVRETYMRTRLADQQRALNTLRTYVDEAGGWLAAAGKVRAVDASEVVLDINKPMGAITPTSREVGSRKFVRTTKPLSPEELADRGLAQGMPGDGYEAQRMGVQWLEVLDRDLWDSVTALTPQQFGALNGVVRALRIPAALQRAGVTAAPEFVTKNPLRDMTFGWVNAGLNPLAFAQGLASVLKKDDFFQLWLHSGAAGSALSSMDRPALSMTLKEMAVAGQTIPGRALKQLGNVITHPIQAAVALSETLENATRVGAFRRHMGKLNSQPQGIQTATQWVADSLLEAGMAARTATVDFSVAGASELVQALRSTTAFFGSAVAGADQFAQSLLKDPVGVSARAFLGITIPSVALYAINRRDPEYMEGIPDWEKNLFWHLRRNDASAIALAPALAAAGGAAAGPVGVGVGLGAGLLGGAAAFGQDADPVAQALGDNAGTADDLWLRFPKPFEPGMVAGSLVERFLQAVDEEDPTVLDEGMDEILSNSMGAFSPVPTAISTLLELRSNKSSFTGDPIIPTSLEDVEKRFQETPGTTEFAKGLAAALNHGLPAGDPSEVSPIEIDHLVRGWSGGLGRVLLGDMGDLAVSGYRAVVPRDDGGLHVPRGKSPAREHMEWNPFTRGFVSRFPYANQTTDDFYAIADHVRRSAATLQYLEETLQVEDLVDQSMRRASILYMQKEVAEMGGFLQQTREQKRQLLLAPGMSPEGKRQQIRLLDDGILKRVALLNTMMKRYGVDDVGYSDRPRSPISGADPIQE